jgi:predicted DNA-binding protein with PD1-like motif
VKQLVIEFTNKKEVIIQKKLKRFEELKIGYFNQNLEDYEEIELDDLGEWLKIHIV